MVLRRVVEEFESLPPKLRARMVARTEEPPGVINFVFSQMGDFLQAAIDAGLSPQETLDMLSVYWHKTKELADVLGQEVEPDE